MEFKEVNVFEVVSHQNLTKTYIKDQEVFNGTITTLVLLGFIILLFVVLFFGLEVTDSND